METANAVCAAPPPESVFGATLADAEEFGEKLKAREAMGFINAPVRDVERETFWDFMASNLPDGDEAEIAEMMMSLEGEF